MGEEKEQTNLPNTTEENASLSMERLVSIVQSASRNVRQTSDGEDDAIDESAKTRSDSVRRFSNRFDDLRFRVMSVSFETR